MEIKESISFFATQVLNFLLINYSAIRIAGWKGWLGLMARDLPLTVRICQGESCSSILDTDYLSQCRACWSEYVDRRAIYQMVSGLNEEQIRGYEKAIVCPGLLRVTKVNAYM